MARRAGSKRWLSRRRHGGGRSARRASLRWVPAVSLWALGLWACSALHLKERFVADGEVIEVLEEGPEQSKEPVRVFLRSAPEGFDFIAGRPVVQPGYHHRLLGRVDLWVDRGVCDGADGGHLSRETVLARLRARAHQEGGDALVYVDTRAEAGYQNDCERIEAVGDSLFDRPWAEAWVARLEPAQSEQTQPAVAADIGLIGMPDAGVASEPTDAGSLDATLPNVPPKPSLPPPPPSPSPKPIPREPPIPPEPAPGSPGPDDPASMVPAPPPA